MEDKKIEKLKKEITHMYTSLRIIFPNNPDVVTRGDYLMYQEVTTTETLGAYINAEWTNTVFYN